MDGRSRLSRESRRWVRRAPGRDRRANHKVAAGRGAGAREVALVILGDQEPVFVRPAVTGECARGRFRQTVSAVASLRPCTAEFA